MYRLIIEDDEGRTTIVPLIRNQINIGREEGNTIRLTERNVSRRHAKLLLKNGQIQVEDLKSYNGVWINGSRIKGRSSLRPGDLLEIGDYHLSIQEESSDAEQSTRPAMPPEQEFDDQTPPVGIAPVSDEGDGEILEIIAPDPAVLLLLNTSEQGKVFDVEWPAVMIGRTEENEISIDHASISRHHAKIVCEDGVYKLYDLDSANGVLVNGQEFKVCDLRWGDVIELGQVRLRFCAADEDISGYVARAEAASSAKAKSGKSLNTMIGVVVLLVLLGGGGIYTLMKKKNNDILPVPRLNNTNANIPTRREPSAARMAEELRREQERQLKLAESLYEQENYKGALDILDRLLKVRSPWKKAEDIQKKALFESKFYKMIEESRELQVEGKIYEMYGKLSQIDKESRYFARAVDTKKQIAPKAVDELLQKVQQAMAEKRYFVAMQWNSRALDIMPKHPEALKLHKQIEKLTAPTAKRIPGQRTSPKTRERNTSPQQRNVDPRDKAPDAREKPTAAPPSRRPVGVLEKCEELLAEKKYSSAQRCLQRVLRRKGEKSVPKVHLLLGNVAAARGSCFAKDTSKRKPLKCLQAQYHYNQFVRLQPNSPEAIKLKKRLPTLRRVPTPPRDKPAPRE